MLIEDRPQPGDYVEVILTYKDVLTSPLVHNYGYINLDKRIIDIRGNDDNDDEFTVRVRKIKSPYIEPDWQVGDIAASEDSTDHQRWVHTAKTDTGWSWMLIYSLIRPNAVGIMCSRKQMPDHLVKWMRLEPPQEDTDK